MSRPPPKGACPHGDGVFFRVWAPGKREVEVVIEDPEHRVIHLGKSPDGMFSGFVPGLGAGALYRYRLDGQGPFPDPASRFQPQGIHGPSEVMDPARFSWTDRGWQGASRENLVIYELHVGTFSPEGTFEGVTRRLPQLAGLGVTAIELMPVADFPGSRNWGYDGVSLFAPARCYGRPDDLRNLVDEAHRLGLAVLLDVVYNHLGPDGNYLAQFTPFYFSNRHQTLWGPAVNLDGEQSDQVRPSSSRTHFAGSRSITWTVCVWMRRTISSTRARATFSRSSRRSYGSRSEIGRSSSSPRTHATSR